MSKFPVKIKLTSVLLWGVLLSVSAFGQGNAKPNVRISCPNPNPRPIKIVRPTYPALARQTHVEGRVTLRCIVVDGLVEKIEVKNGHPLLIQASTDAVSKWKFKPVIVNGQAVEIETIVNIDFQLPKATDNAEEKRNCACAERLTESQMRKQVEHIEMGEDLIGDHVNIKGIALMEVTVDDDGRVSCLKAVSGHALAITHLIEAGRRWKFKPYLKNGSAQRFCGRLRLNFSFVENKPSVEVAAN